MKARIYKRSRNPMQSAQPKAGPWILSYDSVAGKSLDPLMGWASAGDTFNQVHVDFPSLEEAENFARQENLDYKVSQPQARKVVPRNYGDNFRYIPPKDQKNS